MAGRLSLGGFRRRRADALPRVESRLRDRGGVPRPGRSGAPGSSSARRRFSEEWHGTDNDASALLETIGDVDRAPQPLPPQPGAGGGGEIGARSRERGVRGGRRERQDHHRAALCSRRASPDLPGVDVQRAFEADHASRHKQLGLSNVETHSFHACAARYYVPGCRDDETLRRLVEEDAPPRSAISFDCLVVDEAQDMTPLLHRFVLKVLRDARNENGAGSAQMLVLGDSRQSIYQFRDADPRFLTMADRGVYALANRTSAGRVPAWRHHTLRTFFPATPRIASFVNDAMLGFAHQGLAAGAPARRRRGRARDVHGRQRVSGGEPGDRGRD